MTVDNADGLPVNVHVADPGAFTATGRSAPRGKYRCTVCAENEGDHFNPASVIQGQAGSLTSDKRCSENELITASVAVRLERSEMFESST